MQQHEIALPRQKIKAFLGRAVSISLINLLSKNIKLPPRENKIAELPTAERFL